MKKRRFINNNNAFSDMVRTFVLPKSIEKKLDSLPYLSEAEVNGALLYRKHPNEICLIEAYSITGIGNNGHVETDPKRQKLIFSFLETDPSYRFIKFHTHSVGTVRTFGQYYAENFSDEDLNLYNERIRKDPEYVGMVITPKTKLLYGLGNPKLMIVTTFLGFKERNFSVNKSLDIIARRLGISYKPFD